MLDWLLYHHMIEQSQVPRSKRSSGDGLGCGCMIAFVVIFVVIAAKIIFA